MNRAIITISILLSIFISSCGPSAEEIAAAQRRRDDSIAQVTQQRIQAKQGIKDEIARIKNDLENTIADMAAANDRMNHIQEFQFGRSQSTRDEQIRNQTLKIQHLSDKIESLRQSISDQQHALASFQ